MGAPSVATGVASVATKDKVDRSLPVTLESLADLLVTIQSGQERTAARVASIDDHLTSISLTLEGLALNKGALKTYSTQPTINLWLVAYCTFSTPPC